MDYDQNSLVEVLILLLLCCDNDCPFIFHQTILTFRHGTTKKTFDGDPMTTGTNGKSCKFESDLHQL